MPTAADTPIVHHCHRRGAYHAGPKDPAGPECPTCNRVLALAELPDGVRIGICAGCLTWSSWRLSQETGRVVLVEKRLVASRPRPAFQPPVPAAIAAAAG